MVRLSGAFSKKSSWRYQVEINLTFVTILLASYPFYQLRRSAIFSQLSLLSYSLFSKKSYPLILSPSLHISTKTFSLYDQNKHISFKIPSNTDYSQMKLINIQSSIKMPIIDCLPYLQRDSPFSYSWTMPVEVLPA